MCSLKDVNIHLFRMGDPEAILKGSGTGLCKDEGPGGQGEYWKKKKSFSLSTIGI